MNSLVMSALGGEGNPLLFLFDVLLPGPRVVRRRLPRTLGGGGRVLWVSEGRGGYVWGAGSGLVTGSFHLIIPGKIVLRLVPDIMLSVASEDIRLDVSGLVWCRWSTWFDVTAV